MLLVILGLVIICIVIVLIFGDSPSFRSTFLQRFRLKILAANTVALRYLNTLNHPALYWLVPAFYLLVLSFCFTQFLLKTWTILPSKIKFSHFHQFYIFFSISAVYSMTFICMFSNPGYINKFNVGRVCEQFPNNEVIFFSNNNCQTCRFQKPARSKHCSTCDRCVMLFDHHCIWINNCVGYYNYRYFICWLFSNMNFMIYGCYIMGKAIPPLKLFQYIKINDNYKITGAFILLCAIFSVIVGVFTLLQFRYIYLGITTNELDKWSEIEYLIRIQALVEKNGTFYEVVENQLINLQNTEVYPMSDDLNLVNSMEDLDNIYDEGFKTNLKTKLFPKNLD